MALKFGMAGHEIDVMSQRLRVDSETLQKWQFVAGRTGVSILQLMQMFDQMTKNLGRLDTGTERMKALQRLGIDVEMLRSLSPEEQFLTIADAVANADDKTRALGQAQFILGEHVVRLFPLLNEGRAGIARLTEEFDRLGLGMSRDQVKAATAFRNAWFVLGQQLNTILNQLGAAVAPLLTELVSKLSPVLASITHWVKNNQELIASIYKVAAGIAIAGASILALKAAVLGAVLVMATFNHAAKLSILLTGTQLVVALYNFVRTVGFTVIAMGVWKAMIFGVTNAFLALGLALRTALIASGVGAVVVLLGFAVAQLLERIRTGKVDLSAFGDIMFLLREIGLNLIAVFQGFGWAVTSVSDVIEVMFLGALNWVKQFLDWVSLMTTNWNLTWDYMKVSLAIILLKMVDPALMLFNTIKALAIATVMTTLGIFVDMGKGIYTLFITLFRSITGLFTGLWEAVKTAVSGGDLDTIWASFKDQFMREFAKIEGEFPDIVGNAGDRFNEEFVKHMGPDSPFGDLIKDLENEQKSIEDVMRAERDRVRAEREKDLAPELPKEEEIRKQVEISARPLLEAGRFGFQEIGTAVQDALLERDNQLDIRRNDLLEIGIQKQDKIIEGLDGLGALGGLA